MTRTEKIEYIKKEFPDLYIQLKNNVPLLILEPEKPTITEIHIYNQFIVWYSGFLEDASFMQNLSF